MANIERKQIPLEVQRLAERWVIVGELATLIEKIDPERKLTSTQLAVSLVAYGVKFEVIRTEETSSGYKYESQYDSPIENCVSAENDLLPPTSNQNTANSSRIRS